MNDVWQQYQILFNTMAQGAFYQMADGSLVDVNPAALELLGLDHDQFLGRTSCHPEWRIITQDGTELTPDQHPSLVALRTGEPVKDYVLGVYNPWRQGFVWMNVNATPLFHEGEEQQDLHLQAWSTRTARDFCRAEGKGTHHPLAQAGVWADCVYEGRPVIHNDYAALPHRKGLPDGHARTVRLEKSLSPLPHSLITLSPPPSKKNFSLPLFHSTVSGRCAIVPNRRPL